MCPYTKNNIVFKLYEIKFIYLDEKLFNSNLTDYGPTPLTVVFPLNTVFTNYATVQGQTLAYVTVIKLKNESSTDNHPTFRFFKSVEFNRLFVSQNSLKN